ncbi:hypothetical protein NL676_027019 [Syzygium grande]|nr:hypothetical protein NL676_027019 [Syzygium grande]
MLPFWLNNSGNLRRSRGDLSAIHPSSNVLLLFLAASLAFALFVFPSFLDLTSQIFQPPAVKKSWDSLILALALFPIACGLLSRSNHGGSSGSYPRPDTQKSSLSNPTTPCGCCDGCDLWIEYVVKVMDVPVIAPPGEQAAQRKREAKRTYQAMAHKPKDEAGKLPAAPWVPPPPLPPPPAEKSGKKRGGPAIKEFSSSLKMKKKKKKERQVSIENFESLLDSQLPPSSSHQPAPAPPSVFRTLLPSKRGKTREALSAPRPVPPPPAAPYKTGAKPDAVSQSTPNMNTIKKSHTPVTMAPNYDESSDDSDNSGGLSPLIPMAPPRPPFKVPSWTFAMRGHRVWINSPNAQRHKSPDTDDDEDTVSETIESASNASSEATSPVFCPSPDVNKSAGKFIATFKAWLNQEKTNSMKQKRSNLGPEIIG